LANRHYAPIMRPGRRPGDQPRITFFGDSVAWSLGTHTPAYSGLTMTVRAVQGCGIARLPEIIQLGDGFTNYPGCVTWDARWRRGVEADDPDVAAILLDRWELMDRKLNGVYQHVGQAEYDGYLATELELAISIAGSLGARVVLLTAPYTRRAERPDGGLYGEDQPERVDAWNRLVREVAARHSDQVSVIDLNRRVCPDGTFTWSIDGLRIRSDGLHFTPEGVRRWIAPWLVPQLATMAVTANGALARGD
jgi:lysophospholipase L1-like esterase